MSGRRREITRRDFLSGVAVGGAGLLASRARILAQGGAGTSSPGVTSLTPPYPPSLRGMRGSHAGSFEAAHALRDGTFFEKAGAPESTGERFDLVVVGGGPSGLAAAWYFQRRHGGKARVLVLENHDDVGGHARRNEFHHDGGVYLGFGGSFAVQSENPWGEVPRKLVTDLGVDLSRGGKVVDRGFYGARGMGRGIFFDRESWGVDRLVPDPLGNQGGEANDHLPADWAPWPRFLAEAPMLPGAREEFQRLVLSPRDPMPGRSREEKLGLLERMTYLTFLRDWVGAHPEIARLLQTRTHSVYGVGIDAVSALDAIDCCLPGFAGMGLDDHLLEGSNIDCDSYGSGDFYHFPDGNASIVRLLVRDLVPGSLPQGDPGSLVTVPLDYSRLDDLAGHTRIRLASTVVKVTHRGAPASAREVDVTYVKDGRLFTVTAGQVVMACWNMVIPHLCPELPAAQKEALAYGVKVPLVYTSVLVRSWKALQDAGYFTIYSPNGYFSFIDAGRTVRMSSYKACESPDEPSVLHLVRTPCSPGAPMKMQFRLGRTELLATSFEDFESRIRDQLARILGPHGFDTDEDILGITVNRWPHGYTYEYSTLWDEAALAAPELPCVIARRPFGRITIANADAGAYAYIDNAIEQAHRAVEELLAMK